MSDAATPGEAIKFDADQLPNGDRIIRTMGLSTVHHREICVHVSGSASHDYDHALMSVLNYIARYVVSSGATIEPGQTISHGWMSLQMQLRAPGLLEVYEPRDPLSDKPKPEVVPGLERTLFIVRAGDDVMRRNAVTGTSDFANRGNTAICCIHLDPDVTAIQANRDVSLKSNDSGWMFGCGVNQGLHVASDLVLEHLSHVGAQRPYLIPYLLLPVGSMVVFDDEGAIVFQPEAETGNRDPAYPFSFVSDLEIAFSS